MSLPELDIFRGLAAVFMVVNHAGVRLWADPAATQGWGAILLLVSSYAPALFFFATGVGFGLRGAGRPQDLRDTAYKAMLLVVADQLFFWRVGGSAGLDFFSFIALAMLIVSVLALAARPVLWALVLSIAIVLLRYGVGPLFKDAWPQTGVVAALVGVHGQSGVSYPVSPWLCFPLAGFVLGRSILTSHRSGSLTGRRSSAGIAAISTHAFVAAVAVVGALGAAGLALRGASFHRWGSVALAFFVFSAAVLGIAWLLAQALSSQTGRLSAWMSLRGVAAFLVVPLHYLLLEVLARLGLSDLATTAFIPLVLAVCAMTLLVAKRLEHAILWLCGLESALVPTAVVSAVLASIAATIHWGGPGSLPAFAAATSAQLLLAYGLGKRLSAPRRRTEPVLRGDAR